MYILPVFSIGVAVAWYAIYSIQLLRLKDPSRLQRLLAVILLWWGIATLKDLIVYIPGVDVNSLLRHIMYLDGSGAVSFAMLLMELTTPGWITPRRAIIISLPFLPFLRLPQPEARLRSRGRCSELKPVLHLHPKPASDSDFPRPGPV